MADIREDALETDEEKYVRYVNMAVSQWELYPYSNNTGAKVILQYALMLNYCAECLIYMSFAMFNATLFPKESDIEQVVEYLQYARKLDQEEDFQKKYAAILSVYLEKGWDRKAEWLQSQKNRKSKMLARRMNRVREKYIKRLLTEEMFAEECFASWKEV